MLTTIREEQLLAKFAGEDVAVPQPCTRTEKFLAKMAGLDVQTPTPITREEQILNKIAEGGGGGGGDLSIAEVTLIVNDGTGAFALDGGISGGSEGFAFIYPNPDTNITTLKTVMSGLANQTVVLKAVLIEGYSAFDVVLGTIISVSGNATLIDEGAAIEITGDCTITANPAAL